jgi:hypothetical protein
MTTKTNISTEPTHPGSLIKRMAIGAGIGLAVILFFVLQVDKPAPEWPEHWMVRPLIVTSMAGAMAGLFYALMDRFRHQGGWKKALANLISLIVGFIGLWLGIVLGLAGTMWN